MNRMKKIKKLSKQIEKELKDLEMLHLLITNFVRMFEEKTDKCNKLIEEHKSLIEECESLI